jgi:hypothetical protein
VMQNHVLEALILEPQPVLNRIQLRELRRRTPLIYRRGASPSLGSALEPYWARLQKDGLSFNA